MIGEPQVVVAALLKRGVVHQFLREIHEPWMELEVACENAMVTREESPRKVGRRVGKCILEL